MGAAIPGAQRRVIMKWKPFIAAGAVAGAVAVVSVLAAVANAAASAYQPVAASASAASGASSARSTPGAVGTTPEKEWCIEHCCKHLPTPDDGMTYFRCLNQCMGICSHRQNSQGK